MHSSQSSKALTEASRARAAVSPAPILTDQPPRAFTASKPASSVRSSPAKKGIRPANGGSQSRLLRFLGIALRGAEMQCQRSAFMFEQHARMRAHRFFQRLVHPAKR